MNALIIAQTIDDIQKKVGGKMETEQVLARAVVILVKALKEIETSGHHLDGQPFVARQVLQDIEVIV